MAADILIVDDEADIRMLIDGVPPDGGYLPRQAANWGGAIAAFHARRPSLVVLDIWLRNSGLDGLGILEALHREQPHVPVVMISGHGTIETAVNAIQLGAYDFIEKPFKADRLLLIVRRALEAARLAAENAELRLRAGAEAQLIGESAALQAGPAAGGVQGGVVPLVEAFAPPCRPAVRGAQLRHAQSHAVRRGAFWGGGGGRG